MLAKERNQMKAQVVRYRQRLKDAKKFADTQFCNKFNTLTPTQKLFFNMQLKNVKYSPKVNYKKFFHELKSSLQSTCPKRSSIYLKNICFKLQ